MLEQRNKAQRECDEAVFFTAPFSQIRLAEVVAALGTVVVTEVEVVVVAFVLLVVIAGVVGHNLLLRHVLKPNSPVWSALVSESAALRLVHVVGLSHGFGVCRFAHN